MINKVCQIIIDLSVWYILFLYANTQVATLQEERNSLLAENDVLTDRANQLDTFDDPGTLSGRKHNQLQQQLELLQEENFRWASVSAEAWCRKRSPSHLQPQGLKSFF